MQITIKTEESRTIVDVKGDLDGHTAPIFEQKVLPLCQAECKLVLDLTEMSYLSSAGLRVLMALHRQVVSLNGEMVLVGLSPEITDMLSETGFLSYFVVEANAISKAAG